MTFIESIYGLYQIFPEIASFSKGGRHFSEKPFNRAFEKSDFFIPFEYANQPDWVTTEYLLSRGTAYNDLFLYSDAIIDLNEVIRRDPLRIDAYYERALAYFEMNNLELAIEDCKKIRELEKKYANLVAKGSSEYAYGFCSGVLQGGGISLVDFIPSTLSCCSGILHGVWCFVCSPKEVSLEVIDASYALVTYLTTHTARDVLEIVVPEFKELCLKWDVLSEYERGQQVGYIIGKYGVDILAPAAAINGIKKFRLLKRANTLFTIECCASSPEKKAQILVQSAKHAALRQTVCEATKKGKIIAKNANVAPHVMQKKHAWDKLVTLSGIVEEDFAKVVTLLEDHHVVDKSCLVGGPKFFPKEAPKISKMVYEKNINGAIVHVQVETYLDNGACFLQDAWVVTK